MLACNFQGKGSGDHVTKRAGPKDIHRGRNVGEVEHPASSKTVGRSSTHMKSTNQPARRSS
jgi:hypothetical protein